MRYRRIVCFLLGIWAGVSAILALAAYENFNTVETILKSPPEQGSRILKTLGTDDARMLLRYTAGQENARVYEIWEEIQFGIGILATAMLFLEASTRKLALLPLGMVLIIAFQHFKVSPELGWFHHVFAFLPSTAESMTRGQFQRLHAVYGTLEILKTALGLGLVAVLTSQQSTRSIRRSRRRNLTDRLEEPVRFR